MKQALLLAFVVIGLSGIVWAHLKDTNHGEIVRVISTYDIQEKLNDQDTAVTVVEVTIEPGKEGMSHRHPGPVLVYIIKGSYELGLDDQPTKIFQAGETFYEPSGSLHRVSKNPSSTETTQLLAFVLHPRGIKDIAVPEGLQQRNH